MKRSPEFEERKKILKKKIELRRKWLKKHCVKPTSPRYDDVYYHGSAEWVL